MIYVQKVDESLDNPRKYSNYTSRSTKVKHLEVVKLNANNNTEKKNTEKKTTTTGKILVVNLKKPEKQNKEIDILKSEIEQTIKSNIKTQAVKNMINKKGTEKIRYYLNNWDSFVETTKMHSKTGFFIDAVKKEYDIPVKNQIKKAVNKPAQAMNYTQRKYSDEFFDQFYENLRTDVIDEQDNKTSQDTSESDLNAHTDLFENEGDTFHIPDIETPLKTDLNESQVCCSDGRNMNKEISKSTHSDIPVFHQQDVFGTDYIYELKGNNIPLESYLNEPERYNHGNIKVEPIPEKGDSTFTKNNVTKDVACVYNNI
jgi:hypothetical protein